MADGLPTRLGTGGTAYGTFYPHGGWPPTPESSLFSSDEAALADEELTQAEREEYHRGLVTWKKAKSWRFWLRWRWVPWYLLLGFVMGVLTALSIYHREVSHPGLVSFVETWSASDCTAAVASGNES